MFPFVHSEGFHAFFSRFGKVEQAVVMRDHKTGASRGFGFVIFASQESVGKVLSEQLELDDARVSMAFLPLFFARVDVSSH